MRPVSRVWGSPGELRDRSGESALRLICHDVHGW
jgi:hypothetical protein